MDQGVIRLRSLPILLIGKDGFGDNPKHALDRLKIEDQGHYVLSYLSSDRFLSGYAMSRESCGARSLEPYKEFSRPAAVTLGEHSHKVLLKTAARVIW